MTKPRSVAATANDNSIPGSRIEDGTITQEKFSPSVTFPLEDGSVTTEKLDDGAVTADKLGLSVVFDSNVDPTAAISSSKSLFSPSWPDSEGRSVESKLSDTVSVLDFGAKSGSAYDSTEAFQKAIDYCFNSNRRKVLFVPAGVYFVSQPLVINMNSSNNIRVFCLRGEMMGSAVRWGTTIVFTGSNSQLFDVRFEAFPSENFRFEDIALVQLDTRPEFKTSTAIKITKTSTSYNRMNLVSNVACEGFNKFLHFYCPNGTATDPENYFGPILIDRCHTWANNNPIHIENCTLNLFKIKDSLFHGATNYGIFTDDSPLIVGIENTWFEGNEPAAIRNFRSITNIVLNRVGAESTGDQSGWGFLHAWDESAGQRAFNLEILDPRGFNVMPQEFRMPRGGSISSSRPVPASGRLFSVLTPDTIIPVVSNNSAYGQSSTHTSFYVPIGSMSLDAVQGKRCFMSPSGNTGTSNAIHPDSSALPDGLRGRLAGCKTGSAHLTNSSESFTALESGYLYGVVSLKASGNSGWNTGTQMTVDASPIVIDQAFSVENPNGLFGAVVPISSGSTLTQVALNTRGTHEWSGIGDVLFSDSYLTASSVSSLPADPSYIRSIPSSSNIVVRTNGEFGEPYAVRVFLLFNKGALGAYEAVFYGTASNGSKSISTVFNTVDPSIVITPSDGAPCQPL